MQKQPFKLGFAAHADTQIHNIKKDGSSRKSFDIIEHLETTLVLQVGIVF